MPIDLTDMIRRQVRAGLEKNCHFEEADDKDGFVDAYINAMTVVEMIQHMDEAMNQYIAEEELT